MLLDMVSVWALEEKKTNPNENWNLKKGVGWRTSGVCCIRLRTSALVEDVIECDVGEIGCVSDSIGWST